MDERPGERAWDEAQRHPDGLVSGRSTPTLAARLDAWLADARVEGSADARSRERWLQTAAEADATFSGVLLDLAERGTPVAITTVGGRRHQGRIEVLGADFIAVRSATGVELLVVLAAVTAVRTAPLVDPATGERAVTTDLRLTEVLSELAADRTRVLVVPGDGADAAAGELRAVGYDVVTVRTDGDPPGTAYVPVGAISEVVLG